jgi:hypothetical protein
MTRYKNVSGDSGVMAYEIGSDFIKVQFSNGAAYVYNHAVTGSHHVEHMKQLAEQGQGLSSFISSTVYDAYARKICEASE